MIAFYQIIIIINHFSFCKYYSYVDKYSPHSTDLIIDHRLPIYALFKFPYWFLYNFCIRYFLIVHLKSSNP